MSETLTPDEELARDLRSLADCDARAGEPLGKCMRRAADRLDVLARLDREAATHVESVLCLRTHFTGEPPYVGWTGLGLALREALDERDALREALAPFAKAGELFPTLRPGDFDMCIYRPAAGDQYSISGNDLRRARDLLAEPRPLTGFFAGLTPEQRPYVETAPRRSPL